MPSLGKFDALARKPATREQIDEARAKAEAIILTSVGKLQFDVYSRLRMTDILMTLQPATPASTVDWALADNSSVTLTHEQLSDLIAEAAALAGPRALQTFQRAQLLKQTLESGGVVTQRDITLSSWD